MGKNTKIRIAVSLGILLFLAVPNVHADVVGDQHAFSIDPSYDSQGRSQITATLRLISQRGYFYVGDDYWSELNPASREQLRNLMDTLGQEFDSRVYPTETAFFGSEPNPGIDGDPRITFVLTALRYNGGGYFDSSHEYSKSQIAQSNEREMFFLNTSQFTDANRLFSFIAHEFQHMISFNQKEKLRDVSDDIWLNELRSEYAITLIGYSTPYETSNLGRRVGSFLQQPSDSLTEWKNLIGDYGQIALLGEYIVEHWSPRVIANTLATSAISIPSINDALAKEGFHESFRDIFEGWMIANALNDPALGSKYVYTNPNLANIRVSPTQTISDVSDAAVISITANMKDWEQRWYDIRGFLPGNNPVLKITFTSPTNFPMRVPYVVFNQDGTSSVHLTTSATQEIDIPNVGNTVSRVIVMPYLSNKVQDFLADEPSVNVLIRFERVAASAVLHEGDFIRATGDKDIYIINENGYKRIVLSPKICLQYGHLGARGCFDAVHEVTMTVRDSYTTSPYYTNGETEDGEVYRLDETGEDTARLVDLHTKLYQFQVGVFDARSVFRINNLEQHSY